MHGTDTRGGEGVRGVAYLRRDKGPREIEFSTTPNP